MAVSSTLLNWRSSALPVLSNYGAIGVPAPDFEGITESSFVLTREYKGTVQVLFEGDTRGILQAVLNAGGIGGFSDSPPGSFNDVTVDPGNKFVIPLDMNIPTAYEDNVFYTVSEIIGNYTKSEYGKMSATVTLDIFGLPQYLDENNVWKFIPTAEA